MVSKTATHAGEGARTRDVAAPYNNAAANTPSVVKENDAVMMALRAGMAKLDIPVPVPYPSTMVPSRSTGSLLAVADPRSSNKVKISKKKKNGGGRQAAAVDKSKSSSTASRGKPKPLSSRRVERILLTKLDLSPNMYMRLSVQCQCPTSMCQLWEKVGADGAIPTLAVPPGSYFRESTGADLASYTAEVTRAVKQNNLEELRRLHREESQSMQCCNAYGESVIHMACRRGNVDMVKFFLETGVTLRIHDDTGRNPLHDACWAPRPYYELVELLIHREPLLLLMADKRGHTPFSYVRKDDWVSWIRFMADRGQSLVAALDDAMFSTIVRDLDQYSMHSVPNGKVGRGKGQDAKSVQTAAVKAVSVKKRVRKVTRYHSVGKLSELGKSQ